MANKQKHWRLSLMYSKYWWDGNLDFQDDHNKEYLVDGSFAQDNEILLALVVVRGSWSVSESEGEQSSVTGVSSQRSDKFSTSPGNRCSWAPSIFSCQRLFVSAVGVDKISKSVGEKPSSSPPSPLLPSCWQTSLSWVAGTGLLFPWVRCGAGFDKSQGNRRFLWSILDLPFRPSGVTSYTGKSPLFEDWDE